MKLVVQRVLRASVQSEGATVGSIDQGIMVLVGFSSKDALSDASILFPWVRSFNF